MGTPDSSATMNEVFQAFLSGRRTRKMCREAVLPCRAPHSHAIPREHTYSASETDGSAEGGDTDDEFRGSGADLRVHRPPSALTGTPLNAGRNPHRAAVGHTDTPVPRALRPNPAPDLESRRRAGTRRAKHLVPT